MVRSVLIILFLSFALFGKNFIEIIPANVNYHNEDVADFSEYLYETFQNGVAEYNYSQDSAEKMVVLKENATPELRYKTRIKKYHDEIKLNSSGYIVRRELKALIVLDFSSRRAKNALSKCYNSCKINVSLDMYRKNGKKKSKNITLTYDGRSYLFTKSSESKINTAITNLLAY